MQMERTLIAEGCLQRPSIFLRSEIDKISMVKLKDIIKRHQGTIVEKPEDASHIVHPLPNKMDEGRVYDLL